MSQDEGEDEGEWDWSTCDHSLESVLRFFEGVQSQAESHIVSPTNVIVPISIFVASLVTLVAGARIFRIVAMMSAVLFGGYLVLLLTTDSDLSCEVRLVSAATAGVILGVVTMCMVKLCIFFIGAATSAALVHYAFRAFPELHGADDVPSISEKSVIYWIALCTCFVVGGVVARCHSKLTLEIFTSILGGMGIAFSLYSLSRLIDADVDDWVALTIGAFMAVIGVVLQRQRRLKRSTCACCGCACDARARPNADANRGVVRIKREL